MKDRKRGYANFLTATPRHTGARGNRCREYEGVENNAAPPEKGAELDSKTKRILAAE